MKRLLTVAFVLLMLIGLGACDKPSKGENGDSANSGAPDKPSKGENADSANSGASDMASGKSYTNYMNDYYALVLANDGDCNALVKKVNAFFDENGDAMAKALGKDLDEALDHGDLTEMDAKIDGIVADGKKIKDIKCKDDEGFKEASSKLETIMLNQLIPRMNRMKEVSRKRYTN